LSLLAAVRYTHFKLAAGTLNEIGKVKGKGSLDKFWKHQSVKFDFTADLTGTGNRSEEVIK